MITVLLGFIFWLVVILAMKNKTIRDLEYEIEDVTEENVKLRKEKL